MAKGLSFLKEGLNPQEKARITKAFNKAVNEQVKIELAAIVEVQVKGIFSKAKKALGEEIQAVTDSAKTGTKLEIDKISENVGKYIDFMIQENLPGPLVETAGRGLKYADMLQKIEESVKQYYLDPPTNFPSIYGEGNAAAEIMNIVTSVKWR